MTENSILIPLRGGHVHTITDLELQMWTQAYPRVDVRSEVLAMAAWCTANPSKRKTERGIHRFINGWLSRSRETPKTVKLASHKPFKPERPATDREKQIAKEQLDRLQAAIKKRESNDAKR